MDSQQYTLIGAFVLGWVSGTGVAYKVFSMLMRLTDTKALQSEKEGE